MIVELTRQSVPMSVQPHAVACHGVPVRSWGWVLVVVVCALLITASTAAAQQASSPTGVDNPELYVPDLQEVLPQADNPQGVSTTLQIMVMLTVLTLAPSILIMMTCFTRIIVVLALLRQALATQQLPPNQVLIGLALFMTFVVMAPTLQQVNTNALQPYLRQEIGQAEALQAAATPIRHFMIRQIEATDNEQDVYLFCEHGKIDNVQTWSDVPTSVLIPSFMLSELKTAFIIGFRIYLPFLIVDMIIASVLLSMGMLMLPPVLISLPFKILLFVLVDGWYLVVDRLMTEFR